MSGGGANNFQVPGQARGYLSGMMGNNMFGLGAFSNPYSQQTGSTQTGGNLSQTTPAPAGNAQPSNPQPYQPYQPMGGNTFGYNMNRLAGLMDPSASLPQQNTQPDYYSPPYNLYQPYNPYQFYNPYALPFLDQFAPNFFSSLGNFGEPITTTPPAPSAPSAPAPSAPAPSGGAASNAMSSAETVADMGKGHKEQGVEPDNVVSGTKPTIPPTPAPTPAPAAPRTPITRAAVNNDPGRMSDAQWRAGMAAILGKDAPANIDKMNKDSLVGLAAKSGIYETDVKKALPAASTGASASATSSGTSAGTSSNASTGSSSASSGASAGTSSNASTGSSSASSGNSGSASTNASADTSSGASNARPNARLDLARKNFKASGGIINQGMTNRLKYMTRGK